MVKLVFRAFFLEMRFAFISEAYGAKHARDIDRSTDRGAHPGVLSRRSAPFTDEFKAQAVELVLKSGKAVSEVARDLDLVPSALGDWVKQAKAQPTAAQKVLEDQGL